MFFGSFSWSFVYVSLPFHIQEISTLDPVTTLRWTGWILGISPLATVVTAPLLGRMGGRGNPKTAFEVIQYLQGAAFFAHGHGPHAARDLRVPPGGGTDGRGLHVCVHQRGPGGRPRRGATPGGHHAIRDDRGQRDRAAVRRHRGRPSWIPRLVRRGRPGAAGLWRPGALGRAGRWSAGPAYGADARSTVARDDLGVAARAGRLHADLLSDLDPAPGDDRPGRGRRADAGDRRHHHLRLGRRGRARVHGRAAAGRAPAGAPAGGRAVRRLLAERGRAGGGARRVVLRHAALLTGIVHRAGVSDRGRAHRADRRRGGDRCHQRGADRGLVHRACHGDLAPGGGLAGGALRAAGADRPGLPAGVGDAGPACRGHSGEPPARRHPAGSAEHARRQAARSRQHLGPRALRGVLHLPRPAPLGKDRRAPGGGRLHATEPRAHPRGRPGHRRSATGPAVGRLRLPGRRALAAHDRRPARGLRSRAAGDVGGGHRPARGRRGHPPRLADRAAFAAGD